MKAKYIPAGKRQSKQLLKKHPYNPLLIIMNF